MIIDFHTHAFPDKLAVKAMPLLSKAAGGVKPNHEGNISSLKEKIKEQGCDMAVVLNIATNPHQEQNVNRFAVEINKDNIISFGSVHPDSPNAFEELSFLKENGIKGIKLHPDYQNFFVDEERLFPLYEKIASMGFITVFHAGIDIGYPDPVHCTPERLKRALPVFGGAPVIAAHMGGWLMWKDVLKYLCGENLYFDTAFSSSRMPPDYAAEIIKTHGSDKVIFGSDMPWGKTEDEINFVRSLKISDEDKEKILSENAVKLLGL